MLITPANCSASSPCSTRTHPSTHASFHARFPDQRRRLWSTQPDWRKWTPVDETSPTWYTPETLRDLIAALIRAERESGGPAVTVRQFVERFAGLRGTAAQQAVTMAASLHDALLRDLIVGDDLARDAIPHLLHAMRDRARPVSPSRSASSASGPP